LPKESTGDKRRRRRWYKEFVPEFRAALKEAIADSNLADSNLRTLFDERPNPYLGGSLAAPPQPFAEFKKLEIVRFLRKLAQDDYAEEFKLVLLQILLELDAVPPEGVFTPWRKELGAPQIKETRLAQELWIKMGRPKRSVGVCEKLADAAFPKEYAKTKGSRARKNLLDRVWKAVQRLKSGGPSLPGD